MWLNNLVNLEILALIILLNVYIVELLTKIDYNKFIPNNKFGKMLLFIIERYIKLWGTSKQILILLSLIIFILCIFSLKLGFYFIVKNT